MSIVLGIDVCLSEASLAVSKDGMQIAELKSAIQGKSEIILELVRDVLTQAECSLSQVETIVVGIGPGSFSGIRTGLSCAQGLWPLAKPKLIGISNMLARACSFTGTICVCQDASPSEFYVCIYDIQNVPSLPKTARALSEIMIIPRHEWENVYAGLSKRYKELFLVNYLNVNLSSGASALINGFSFSYSVDPNISDSHLQYQIAVNNQGIKPFYVKQASAKTLLERKRG